MTVSSNDKGIIYQARNVLNGKIYVGATQMSLYQRSRGHRASAKFGKTRFAKAIAQHGFDNFEWTVLAKFRFSKERVEKEALFICKLKALDEAFGYNQLMSKAAGLSKPFSVAICRGISFSAEDHDEIADAADRNDRSFACEVRWRCKQMATIRKNAERPCTPSQGRDSLERMGVS